VPSRSRGVALQVAWVQGLALLVFADVSMSLPLKRKALRAQGVTIRCVAVPPRGKAAVIPFWHSSQLIPDRVASAPAPSLAQLCCQLFAEARLRAAAVTTFFQSVETAGYAQPVLPLPRR
jgi:hypothetical protein